MQAPNLEKQLIDIYSVIYTPFWRKPLFYIPVFIIGFLLLGAIIYWLHAILSKKRALTQAQKAQNQIKMLQKTINPDNYQQFYFRLTAILKQYLEGVLGDSYMSKTDQEVVLALEQVDFPLDLRETINRLFAGSQTIKFANSQAAVEQMQNDIQAAMKLIKQTIPEQQ